MYFDAQLWAMTAGHRLRMFCCALLGLAALAAGIARFALLGRFFALLFAGETGMPLVTPLAGVALAILARAGFEHALNRSANLTAARIQAELRGRLYDTIVSLGPTWFGHARTGGVMLTVVDGVEQLQTFFGRYLPQLFIALCAPLAIFSFIAYWDLPVALVLLVAALATLVLPLVSHASHRGASLDRQRAFKAFGEEFLDAVQGLPTLKSFGQSQAAGERLAERARSLSDNTFRVLGREVSARFVTDLGITTGAAAALALGAWRVTQGDMTLAALLVILMAGTEIFRPLRDLRSVLHQGMVGQSAASGVLALLNSERDAPVAQPGASAVLPPSGAALSVDFEQVAFAYPGSRQATHDGLSLSIRAGERIGIVGPSGSGKSSLVRLLMRLHDPQSGCVRIGGVDIRQLDPAAVRARIALVAQDSTLFHGTVEENLRMGRPDASLVQLQDAARAANAHAFIMAMPQGYQSMIGERGTRLSGGQRQRLTIARALLRDAPILILDEALSSVDAENEAEIQQALDRLSAGRTTLVLAHRLSSVIGADRILVLDGGRIVESGRHEDLLARGGLYFRLMGTQAREARAAVSPVLAVPADNAADNAAGPALRPIDADAAEIGLGAVFQTLREIIRPWRKSFAITVASGIGRVAAFIAVSVCGAAIVASLKAGSSFDGLMIGLFVAAIAAACLHWIESWLAHAIAYKLLAEMRIALFAKLDALAPAYLLKRRAGDLVALAAQDVETVEYFFAHTVAPAFVAVFVPLVVLAVLGVSSWPLVFALMPFLLWAAASPLRGRRRIDLLGGQARASLGLLSGHLTETIQGLPDLLAFSATERRREAFIAIVQRYQAGRIKLLADLSRQGVLLEVTTGLGGLAVAATGAWLTSRGQLDPRLLPLLMLLSVAAFLPVSEIAQVSRQLADTLASTRRLRAVHDEPVLVTDGPLTPPIASGGLPLRFDQVSFTYPGQSRSALQQVTLDVPAGATVALVGASGAGKSTLASLLMRFWDPQQGVVEIAGTDLRALSLAALHARIALVAQDTWLMNGTLESNIRLARPDASHAQLMRAVQQAALTDFVASLPEGLQTPVGERGMALSGGQRQRIAIARAFLRNAPILILDEATSHLDAISESLVHEALAELMQDRTTLVIAHRLSTIRQADLIVVMAHGRVAESGTHAALLAQGGIYARLIDRQMNAAMAA